MFSTLANPHRFMKVSNVLLPIFAVLAVVLLGVGLYQGYFIVPAEKYQGDTARIMFVHVPAAWLSMASYGFMAVASLVFLIWKHTLADHAAKAAAPAALVFTFIALITGSIWGRPTWGTYWTWDARITSMLVQLFLVAGYLALRAAMSDTKTEGRAAAILCLVGFINLPIIKFSVDWWNTLHQPASVFRLDGPTMPAIYLWPLLVNGLGAMCLFAVLVMLGMRTIIMRRRYDVLLSRQLGAST